MKPLRSLIQFTQIAALVAAPALCFAQHGGGSVSGGADDAPEIQAWFQSSNPQQVVSVCVTVAPDFGFSRPALSLMVETAFAKWADYYLRLGGNLDPRVTPKTCSIEGVDRTKNRIATQMRLIPECDGTQDLTVFFGTRHPRNQPGTLFAEAALERAIPAGHNQGEWSRGYIWIAPPKSVEPEAMAPIWTSYEGAPLEFAILHEMGHVFGSEHIAGTVMEGKITKLLKESTQYTVRNRKRSEYDGILEIDQSRMFAFVPQLAINAGVRPPVSRCRASDEVCNNNSREAFSFVYGHLTGYQLRSDFFEATLTKPAQELLSWDERGDDRYDESLELIHTMKVGFEIRADGMTHHFDFVPINAPITDKLKVFKNSCRYLAHQQADVFGFLKGSNGTSRFMNLKINWGSSKLTLVDPTLEASEPYCSRFSSHREGCVLLKLSE